MPNYKEMYLKMMRASEQAIRTLIKAQRGVRGIIRFRAGTDGN